VGFFSFEKYNSTALLVVIRLHNFCDPRYNVRLHSDTLQLMEKLNITTKNLISFSFEQFCINYCNEKLQQLFIELVLKQEQEEYQRENINWQHIDYFNNKIICDLVEQPHKGMISIIDEASFGVGNKVDDEVLLEHLSKQLKDHKHFTSRGVCDFKFQFKYFSLMKLNFGNFILKRQI
jgi:hypothetical protein